MHLLTVPVVALEHASLCILVALGRDDDSLGPFGLRVQGPLCVGARLLDGCPDDDVGGFGEVFEDVVVVAEAVFEEEEVD